MTRYLTRDRAAIAAAVVVPLALAAILLPWRGGWPNTNVALLLVVAVVAVAAAGSRIAGALAAVIAAAWFDFFYTVPYERFTIRHSSDVTTFVLLFVVGVAVSQLAAWARHLKAVTIADAGYLALISESAALSRSADSPDEVVEHVRRQLIGHWPADESGLPEQEIELRAYGNGQYYGRFMMTPRPGSRPPQQARLVAVTLAELAGYALGATAPAADPG